MPKLTNLCGCCCTPKIGAPQESGVRGVAKASDRSVIPNESNSPIESLPGSLTTELEQSSRAQAPTETHSIVQPQPGGGPGADCELCTLQVRSDQVFGPAELLD